MATIQLFSSFDAIHANSDERTDPKTDTPSEVVISRFDKAKDRLTESLRAKRINP